jgi:hypothetical protein
MWVLVAGLERNYDSLWDNEQDAKEWLKVTREAGDIYAEVYYQKPAVLAEKLEMLRISKIREAWYEGIRQEWEDLGTEYYLPQDELSTMVEAKPERDWDREREEFHLWAESKSYLTRVRNNNNGGSYKWSYPE